MTGRPGELRLELELEPGLVLSAERLRDGRIALGTRRRDPLGNWQAGELTILRPRDALSLAGWFAPLVEDTWLDTVRERAGEIRRTARELYGDSADAENRLAEAMLNEIPPGMLRRAFVLLTNSVGPASRDRLIGQLNRTEDFSEEAILRRRLAEEQEAFGYAIAAAALFDLIERKAAEPEPEG